MPQVVLDPDTTQLLVKRLMYMLKALHEAEKIESRGFESTSWQGQLAGFRCAIETIFGPEAAGEILEVVRDEACKKLGETQGDALLKRGFPGVEEGPDILGYIYVAVGQHERALVEGHKALEKKPASARSYAFLIGCYILLNRLCEARVLLDEAERKNIDSPGLHFSSYMLAFLNRDVIGMQKQVEWGIGKPGVEDVMLSLEANTRAFFGQLGAARDFSRRAVSSAELLGEKELAARYQVDAALREALFGNAVETRQWAESALRLSNGRNVKYRVALALAFAGDLSNAKSLIDDFDARVPQETVIQFNYLPTLSAQIALSQNDSCKAIEALQVASPHELGTWGKTTLYPVYVRGEAFLITHQGKHAVAEFNKILDHPGIALNGPIGVRGRLGLAQAYARQGETAQAKAAYLDFLTLWKDADPDIPILKQAQQEYAKLQ